MKLLQILTSFFKVGCIGFGGGSALIPVVEREIVKNRGAMDEDAFLKHNVVSNITPGTQPVKLGATCGFELGGAAGSVIGSYAVMIPGVLLTVAVMAIFSAMGDSVIRCFNYASVGISAFIIYLLLSYVAKTVGLARKRINIVLCALSFAVTGGKEIRQVAASVGLNTKFMGEPIFDIPTVSLIIIAFYLILFTQKAHSKPLRIIGWALSGVYAFLCGKTAASLGFDALSTPCLILMLILLACIYILAPKKKTGKKRLRLEKKTVIAISVFLLIPTALTAFSSLSGQFSDMLKPVAFIGSVAISALTSFGGGTAYISVAEGMFVQGGSIASDVFYSQLVPVANALPGPTLVKIAAGTGYVFGAQSCSPAMGWLLAFAAGTTAVGVCCALALAVLSLYESIKESEFILNLKRFILPVICGMLISTSLSMLAESMKITAQKGIPGFAALPVILLCVLGMDRLIRRFRIHDVAVLLCAAALSFSLLMLI